MTSKIGQAILIEDPNYVKLRAEFEIAFASAILANFTCQDDQA